MGLLDFTHTKVFKQAMGKLYGIGASVVLLGALFKIQHYPGADIMLILGLGTEAFIFFMSAFEPIHSEPDWSLVYPELAGLEDEEEAENRRALRSSGHAASAQAPAAGSTQNISLSGNLDKLLEEANIGPELIENLGEGLRNLSENTQKLADMSNAAVATNNYIKNMEAASQSVLELNESYKNTAEYLKHDLSLNEEYANSLQNAVKSLNEISQSYHKTAETAKENLQVTQEYTESIKSITGSTNQLAEVYANSAESLTKTAESLQKSTEGSQQFSNQLQETVENLSALNAVYELQLQSSNEQYQHSSKLQETMSTLIENLENSAGDTQNYRDEMNKLTNNISALNNVYGNMLSAMNMGK